TLADKGYTGADKGYTGCRDRCPHADQGPRPRCRNTLLSAMRAPAERANAPLKTRWKALQRISLCP
ncbi:transposase family protein, partial [Rhodococcus pyridinivorans]|uniref:transposase family protein n=1 Tax=Rhodococcus pyridinivorans TaxID=103816 RepID=UPI003558391D